MTGPKSRKDWTDVEMLDALDMRDRGMRVEVIAGKLGRSAASVHGMFKRVDDDLAAADMPREAAE